MAREDDTLADVVKTGIDSALLDLHTSMPGKVISYDETKETCEVQPVVRRKLDGELETLPKIKNVPVAWPSAGGAVFKPGPLEAGDTVLLVFSEASWAKYRTTGQVSEAGDETRHSLSYPIAYPFAREPIAAATGAGWYTTVPVYVGDPSATFVALFAGLVALRTAIMTDLTTGNGGGPVSTAALAALDTPTGTFAATGSATKLKAK